jgi:ribose transport system ATP-binding protein
LLDNNKQTGQIQSRPTILEMKGICKSFFGVTALNNVSFNLRAGEVHALLGGNGSGKSTLIKILSGVYYADAGQVYIDGQPVNCDNSAVMQSLGVATVHQEINLIPNMDVASNMFLNQEPKKGKLIDFKAMYSEARSVLDKIGLDLDPKMMANRLSVAEMQMLEIGKAMAKKMRILVLDEPTAALPAHEVEVLFSIINKLRDQGIGIIYVSHRLEEIERLADRVTIIRDGEHIITCDKKDITMDQIIRHMVGREIEHMVRKRDLVSQEVVMRVENLSCGNTFSNISFELKKGEILGIAGLVGSGRTELASALGGAVRTDGGAIYLGGQRIKLRNPLDALNNGIGLLPSERKKEGIATLMSVRDNIIMSAMDTISCAGMLTNSKIDRFAQSYVDKLNIKTPNLQQKVSNLSGGNQQKVVLGKVLACNSNILVFDEPTRGIDVSTRREIYGLMSELSDQGKSIILSSSDLHELLDNSDRIITMYDGRIVDEFDSSVSMEDLLRSVLGQSNQAGAVATTGSAQAASGISACAEPVVNNVQDKDASLREPPRRDKKNLTYTMLTWGVPIFTVLMIVFFALSSDKFLSSRNLTNFSRQLSLLIVISCGQAFALITRGIDMSIGSMMALTSMVLAAITISSGSIVIGLLAAAAAVLLLGILNGVFIGGLDTDAFVITLGMMYVCRGGALVIGNGQPVFGLPEWFAWVAKGQLGVIPVLLIIAIVVAVVFQIILTRTSVGRHITALGGNREGAIFSGVNVSLRLGTAYVFSALLAGMAGLMMASRMFSGQPNMGISAHLEATTAAIIGGISLVGGRGDIFGVVLGAILLTVVSNGMNIIGVSSYNQDTVLGLVLIFALILDRLRQIALEKNR